MAFKIARLYGVGSWPKPKAHVDSFREIRQLKQAIDTNEIARVKTVMTRNPALHSAPLGYGKDGPLTWVDADPALVNKCLSELHCGQTGGRNLLL